MLDCCVFVPGAPPLPRSRRSAKESPPAEQHPLTTRFLAFARDLAASAEATAILVYADVFKKPGSMEEFVEQCDAVDVVLATRDAELFEECKSKHSTVLRIPPVGLTRVGQIKMAVLIGFTEGVFRRGDRLVCLTGFGESGLLDTVLFMETQEEYELFALTLGEQLVGSVHPEVFERLLGLAADLANEGREGKPVGTTFVIGDEESVLKHSDQMIFNPFKGYPREQLNVLDPALEETLKEFSALDGAFIVSGDGHVETAGAYLRSTVPGVELPRGLGARHQSAAAITAATQAVAITVSESTGTVTVYHGGKILVEIEKPRPIGEGGPPP
jgi:DNA integrity scanning protein DisA with diadenylate cyclase activity